MTTILLARHGETDWNRERRVQGHTDRPLNAVGEAQARELAERLADERIDAIYASDLSRAYDTALYVADPRGLAVVQLADLRERHFGTWEGLTDMEILERFPHASTGSWGDGETPDEMSVRIVAALRAIAAEHADGQVLVVSHGGPMRAMLRRYSVEVDGPIPNCHVIRLAVENGEFRPLD